MPNDFESEKLKLQRIIQVILTICHSGRFKGGKQ
nr:MAG TPA: hypothetical protein [Bacteriophage sp.]